MRRIKVRRPHAASYSSSGRRGRGWQVGKISLVEPTGWYRWDRRRRQKRLILRFLVPLTVALWAFVIIVPSARAVVHL
jgi:hypothetical protein